MKVLVRVSALCCFSAITNKSYLQWIVIILIMKSEIFSSVHVA